jgi:CBS domain containing-hemolysin-like protein
LVAVDRDKVDAEARLGRSSAQIAAGLLRRLSFHLSGAQLGITVSSLLLGFIAEPTVARVLEAPLEPLVGEDAVHGVAIAVALALVTIVQMVAGELIPKNLSIARPLPSVLALARPIQVVDTAIAPLIVFFNRAANWTVRRLGIEPQEELQAVRSLEELELLFRSSGAEGALDPLSLTLLTRSIRFGDKTAADALVPRVAVDSLGRDEPVDALLRKASETGHSRFPVTGRDIDDVVGVVHVKDVLSLPPHDRRGTPVAEIMQDPVVVPESRDLESIFADMRSLGRQLVTVVDEYGGTAGILTLEDVVEEIVGDIEDEYDPVTESPAFTAPVAPGTHLLEGTLHPDEVLERSGFGIPEGDYETLAGFVLFLLGHIPDVGERVEHEGWDLEVVDLDGLRIARILLTEPHGEDA